MADKGQVGVGQAGVVRAVPVEVVPVGPARVGLAQPARQAAAGGAAVLDTNVVLDWLVFDDAAVLQLAVAIEIGRLRWIGTAETMQELVTVLSRPGLERWQVRLQPALQLAQRLCTVLPSKLLAPAQVLPCTDPDDQKFIDFAVAHRVPWLFSRDKALLRLARRALPQGVRVLRPVDWHG